MITILPNGHNLFAKIEEMPDISDECPICDMVFPEMTSDDVIQEHEKRCMGKKLEERKVMIAAGYKLTSHGWIMK